MGKHTNDQLGGSWVVVLSLLAGCSLSHDGLATPDHGDPDSSIVPADDATTPPVTKLPFGATGFAHDSGVITDAGHDAWWGGPAPDGPSPWDAGSGYDEAGGGSKGGGSGGTTGSATGASGTTGGVDDGGIQSDAGTTGDGGSASTGMNGHANGMQNGSPNGRGGSSRDDCASRPDGSACDLDDDLCSFDLCIQGECQNVANATCAFLDNVCSRGVCDPSSGTCTSQPVREGGRCTDGDGCTYNTVCSASGCTGGSSLSPLTGCAQFVEEQEPNDGYSAPDQTLTGSVDIAATLHSADEDWFVLEVPASTTVHLWTDDASGSCQVDTVVEVYDADLTPLATNDDSGVGLCSDLTLGPSGATRQLWVRLRGYLGRNRGLYVLHVEY